MHPMNFPQCVLLVQPENFHLLFGWDYIWQTLLDRLVYSLTGLDRVVYSLTGLDRVVYSLTGLYTPSI